MTNRAVIFLCFLASALCLSSCATAPIGPPGAAGGPNAKRYAFVAEDNVGPYSAFSPVFIVENYGEPINRIGTVRARLYESGESGFVEEELFVDHTGASFYVQRRGFTTSRGSYTNLLYRVHFEETPLSLFPFYLSAGRNIGLFVIVTLNDAGVPVLFTTVHSCGCYLAFVPTSYLPEDALPKGWNKGGQRVFGERLPGMLEFPEPFNTGMKAVITLRSSTHRVGDLRVERAEGFGTEGPGENYTLIISTLMPIEALEAVPLAGGGTTSFYEKTGPRAGYVKGSRKPWERLLMSWWALDWRIGEDKLLGEDSSEGTVFYTSLKFWDRESSDMRDFPKFLAYWGWGL